MSENTRVSHTAPVDVRGPRFAAWITTAVLIIALLASAAGATAAAIPTGIQAVVFALTAALGPRRGPYGRLYAAFIAPRLSPPTQTEPTAPLRFAQLIGLICTAVAFGGFVGGAAVLGVVFVAVALFAAFLNAAFGLCLGCQLYPLLLHVAPRRPAGPGSLPDAPASAAVPETAVTASDNADRRRWERNNMARSDVLVSADWVQQNLNTPGVVVVEVDEDTTAYDKGHIAGAVKLDWKKDLQDPVRRDFLDQEQFSKLLSERGIGREDTVILYGGNNNWFAAYAYWYFKLYGHRDVKLLDGGRKKWELDGRELSSDTITRTPTTYQASAQDRSIRAFRDEVIAAIGAKNLVDVRSPDEFSGKVLAPPHLPQEQSQRPGHIPGAINIPWSKAANEDGTFKSDDELTRLYTQAGLDGTKETIAYCRIGERSSHTWFVLRELLHHTNVKNYDGSWTEYGSLVGAPIELGA